MCKTVDMGDGDLLFAEAMKLLGREEVSVQRQKQSEKQ